MLKPTISSTSTSTTFFESSSVSHVESSNTLVIEPVNTLLPPVITRPVLENGNVNISHPAKDYITPVGNNTLIDFPIGVLPPFLSSETSTNDASSTVLSNPWNEIPSAINSASDFPSGILPPFLSSSNTSVTETVSHLSFNPLASSTSKHYANHTVPFGSITSNDMTIASAHTNGVNGTTLITVSSFGGYNSTKVRSPSTKPVISTSHLNDTIITDAQNHTITQAPFDKVATYEPALSLNESVTSTNILPYSTGLGIIPQPKPLFRSKYVTPNDTAAEFPSYSDFPPNITNPGPANLPAATPIDGTSSLIEPNPFNDGLGNINPINTFVPTFIKTTPVIPEPSFTSSIPYPFPLPGSSTSRYYPLNNKTDNSITSNDGIYNNTIKSTRAPQGYPTGYGNLTSHSHNITYIGLIGVNSTAPATITLSYKLNMTGSRVSDSISATLSLVNQTASLGDSTTSTMAPPYSNQTVPAPTLTLYSNKTLFTPFITPLDNHNTPKVITVSYRNQTTSTPSKLPVKSQAVYSVITVPYGNQTASKATKVSHKNPFAPFSNDTAPQNITISYGNHTTPTTILVPNYNTPTLFGNKTESLTTTSICSSWGCYSNRTAPVIVPTPYNNSTFSNNTSMHKNNSVAVFTKTTTYTLYRQKGRETITTHVILPCSTESYCEHHNSHATHRKNETTITILQGQDYTTVTIPVPSPSINETSVTIPYSRHTSLKEQPLYTTITLELSHTTKNLSSTASLNTALSTILPPVPYPNVTVSDTAHSYANSTVSTFVSPKNHTTSGVTVTGSHLINGTVVTMPYNPITPTFPTTFRNESTSFGFTNVTKTSYTVSTPVDSVNKTVSLPITTKYARCIIIT